MLCPVLNDFSILDSVFFLNEILLGFTEAKNF